MTLSRIKEGGIKKTTTTTKKLRKRDCQGW